MYTSRLYASRVADRCGRSLRTGRDLAHPSHSGGNIPKGVEWREHTSHNHPYIRGHTEACCALITLDHFPILDSCSNSKDLRNLESLFIFKQRPMLINM